MWKIRVSQNVYHRWKYDTCPLLIVTCAWYTFYICISLSTPEPDSITGASGETSEPVTSVTATDDVIRLDRLRDQTNEALLYIYPALLAAGLLCNGLSFIVIIKSDIFKTSTGVYLAVLCWADTSALIHWILIWWVGPLPHIVTHAFIYTCNLRQVILTFSNHTGAMCVICVTVDRFIAVYFPFQAKLINTRKRAAIVLVIIALCILAMYSPMLVAFYPNCELWVVYALYAGRIVFILSTIFYTYGPIILLVCLNVAIICKLRVSSTIRKRAHVQSESGSQSKIMASVLAVSVAYILCQVPYNTLFSIRLLGQYSIPGRLGDVLINVSRILIVVNHSGNFFLYVLTSRNFRETLRGLLPSCCSCQREPTVTTTSSVQSRSTKSTELNDTLRSWNVWSLL